MPLEIRTILVPTDFSVHANKAVEAAIELAKTFSARIEVLHAYHLDIPVAAPGFPGGVVLPDGFYEEVRLNAERQVAETVSRVTAQGVSATGHVVADPAALAITEAAEQVNADLIVMGTRGLSGLKHVLLGSVAERTVRSAPCPVMTVKADDE